jgi:phosphoglycerol transferase MdoB-like AlkP superfamily enzyme
VPELSDRKNTDATKFQAGYVLAVISFVILNSLKTTLFNFFIMNSNTAGAFIYKFIFTLLICIIFCYVIFSTKSHYPFLIFYLVQAVYIFANLSYYGYFHNYLHLFQSAALFTEGVGSIKHFTIPVNLSHLIILLDLPLFIYLVRSYKSMASLNLHFSLEKKYLLTGSVLLLVCFEVWNYSHSYSAVQAASDYAAGEDLIVERYGTVANSMCDIIFNQGGKNLISHFQYGNAMENTSSSTDKPNIIAIQVEAMDSNIINQKYKDKYIVPYLHMLSQKSVYYPYTLSYHKSGGTSDSEFSIINSVEPLGNFPSIKLTNYDYPNSMVDRLAANSYHTMAFHGNIGNFYNRNVAFDKMGFKEFYDIEKMGFKDTGWGAPDGDVFDFALKKLEGQDTPFLSYIITMSSHTPFTNVERYYNNKDYDNIQDSFVKNYFNSMSYVDLSIEEFVTNIRENYKNTYILIWGDHTPNIKTNEYTQAAFMEGSNYFEFVPMFIITPDSRTYKESRQAASFMDISTTVLHASGINFNIRSFGTDLLKTPESDVKIPFKGQEFDRSKLYDKIKNVHK